MVQWGLQTMLLKVCDDKLFREFSLLVLMCHLWAWHVWQFLTCNRMVFLISNTLQHLMSFLFKMGVSRILQIVVVPANWPMLNNVGTDYFVIFAKDLSIIFQLSGSLFCLVSSVLHCPSGHVQFPVLLMGKLHLLCCNWQTPCSLGVGECECSLW